MINLIVFTLIGTILLGASIRLEAQTTYKGSTEYNKLIKIGGSSAIVAWISIMVIMILGLL